MVIAVDGEPERVYGHEGLESKYLPEDDGGPSYWWRDKRVRAVHERMRGANVAASVQDRIVELFGPVDTDILERLDRYLAGLPNREITNLGEILDGFVEKETSRCFRRRILHAAAYGSFPVLLAYLFTTIVGGVHSGWLFYLLTAVTILALLFGAYEAGRPECVCFDAAALSRREQELAQR